MANRWGNSGNSDRLYYGGGAPKSLQMSSATIKLKKRKKKTFASWQESYDHPGQHIKKQRHYFANKGPSTSRIQWWILVYCHIVNKNRYINKQPVYNNRIIIGRRREMIVCIELWFKYHLLVQLPKSPKQGHADLAAPNSFPSTQHRWSILNTVLSIY